MIGASHAAHAGARCTDRGDGTCLECGAALVTCESCSGVGYHRPGCDDGEGCPSCAGELAPIGQLGALAWFRCRDCGDTASRGAPAVRVTLRPAREPLDIDDDD